MGFIRDLKNLNFAWALKYFRGKSFINFSINKAITISRDGLGEWKTVTNITLMIICQAPKIKKPCSSLLHPTPKGQECAVLARLSSYRLYIISCICPFLSSSIIPNCSIIPRAEARRTLRLFIFYIFSV